MIFFFFLRMIFISYCSETVMVKHCRRSWRRSGLGEVGGGEDPGVSLPFSPGTLGRLRGTGRCGVGAARQGTGSRRLRWRFGGVGGSQAVERVFRSSVPQFSHT